MPTPDTHDPHEHAKGPGYEVTDASVSGVVIFLISMGVLAAVLFVFCFGLGKVINTALIKHDGPLNKWNAAGNPEAVKPGNLTSDADIEQQQLSQMVARFPTPRLLTDNGDQEVVDMHAREDLLLDHYSWIDQQQGKVRIPIARAMELVAQHGLPVAPQAQTEPLMTADKALEVPVPLTNGFARTGFEQHAIQTMAQQRMEGESPGEQAALRKRH